MTKPKRPGELKGKSSKLTAEDVLWARTLHAQGRLNIREFAGICGVGTETLRRAVRGDTWGEVSAANARTEEVIAAEAAASEARMIEAIAAEKRRQAAGAELVEELEALSGARKTNPYY